MATTICIVCGKAIPQQDMLAHARKHARQPRFGADRRSFPVKVEQRTYSVYS
jgi:hypothetical protein